MNKTFEEFKEIISNLNNILERGDEIANCWENKEYQEANHYNWLDDQNEKLKQQILDAENAIRELSFGELSDCIGNRKEVAETYWSKYGKE